MTTTINPNELVNELHALGIDLPTFANAHFPTPEDAQAYVEQHKAEAKKRFKTLAKKSHPDHGGDPEAFIRLERALAWINTIQIEPRPITATTPATTNATTPDNFVDLVDIINSLIKRAPRQPGRKPPTVVVEVVMNLDDLFRPRR